MNEIRIKEQINKAYDEYMHSYFTLRDSANIANHFHKNAIGLFGTGLDEVARDYNSWIELYYKDLASITDPINVKYKFRDIHLLSNSVGLVMTMFDINAIVDELPMEIPNLRMSIIFTFADGCWKIIHKHISTPSREHEVGEPYPLTKLEEMNKILEKRVQKKTHELEVKNKDLEISLQRIKGLERLLTICSHCKNIRKEDGEWERIDWHISSRSSTKFTHTICPPCEIIYYK